MWTFFRNVHYSARSLGKSPGFTLAAVLTLALGVGANTAVFSVVDAAVLRPLPYRDAGKLVVVWDQLLKLGFDQFPVTFANYDDYRRENRVFEDIAAFNTSDVNLEGSGDSVPERLQAMAVSANLFPLLGVSPALGQTFQPDQNDPGRGDGVILSDALWRRRFAADPGIVGQSMRLDGRSYRVEAVMPPGFAFTILSAGGAPDVWIPLTLQHGAPRDEGSLRLIARLKAGIPTQQAQANLSAVAAGIEAAFHPYTGPRGEDAGYRVSLVPLRDQLFGSLRATVLILAGAVVFVLLIACANVANLLLARGARRGRELAIRAALGASWRQLLAELGAESLLLSLAGASLGVLLARWGVKALLALGGIPEHVRIAIDLRVLSFTLLLSLATGLVFGLAPALRSARAELDLTGGRTVVGAERKRLPSGLIAAEVALSVVLLIGAGLLLKSLGHLRSVEPGFDARNILTMQVTLPAVRYSAPRSRISFFEHLSERLRNIAGVESAALVSQLPLAGGRGGDPFSIEGRPYDSSGRVPQAATRYRTSPEYFRTMRIPLLAGRLLAERDGPDSPRVAVINQTMARGFWGAGNPIGRHIMMGAPRPGVPWLTIVGLVADVRGASLRLDAIPQIYTPFEQEPGGSMYAVLRTATDPMSIALAARRQISALDRGQAAWDVRTMEERLSGSIQRDRFEALLFGIFALAALALAVIGIYGVLDHSVSQRVPEIGLRMALGAQPGDVLRLIVTQGMRPAFVGLVLGLIATFPLARVLRGLLFQVAPTDAVTFVVVPVLFTLVALAASAIPARKAIRLDPARALLADR